MDQLAVDEGREASQRLRFEERLILTDSKPVGAMSHVWGSARMLSLYRREIYRFAKPRSSIVLETLSQALGDAPSGQGQESSAEPRDLLDFVGFGRGRRHRLAYLDSDLSRRLPPLARESPTLLTGLDRGMGANLHQLRLLESDHSQKFDPRLQANFQSSTHSRSLFFLSC